MLLVMEQIIIEPNSPVPHPDMHSIFLHSNVTNKIIFSFQDKTVILL
jgi:hypothetical protein